jgi:hypothetical protein
MDAIIATRCAPMVLPQVLYPFPSGDYMKYFPRFNGEGEVTIEEHFPLFTALQTTLMLNTRMFG